MAPVDRYERSPAHSWIRSNVLGLVAIFIALNGTAIATQVAKNAGEKKGAQVSAKKVKRGPPGPAGPAGAAGPQGIQGVQGSPGPTPGTVSGGPGGQIIDNTVDNADLAPNAEFSGTQVPAGDLAGSFYPSPTLAMNSVGVNEIAPDSVSFDELAPSSVGSLEVNDAALAIQDIAEGTGTTDFNESLILTDACFTVPNEPAAVDPNDIIIATPSADTADILYVTAIPTSGGGTFDLSVCNPFSTGVNRPDFVRWAVIEVP